MPVSADEGTTHAFKYPDPSFTSIAYSGNFATTTDPAGKARKLCSDGLGRITSANEDPNVLNYQTNYTYDLLNDLCYAGWRRAKLCVWRSSLRSRQPVHGQDG